MKAVLIAVLFGFLCFGCDKQIKVDSEDPIQQIIVISATRVGVAAYLEKNNSEESIEYVLMLGKTMSQINTPDSLKLTIVEVKKVLYYKAFDELNYSLSPTEQEGIRAFLDTTTALVYKYAAGKVNIKEEYVDMLAMVGQNILEVAEIYEVSP